MDQRFRVQPLAKHHDRASFSSGTVTLDRYLRQQAGQDVARRVAAVFVLTERRTDAVVGYYTLSSTSVHLTDLPPDLARKLPRYPAVPAVLLGRLAIDERRQGERLGSALLMDALRRALAHSVEVAAVAVVVDAKDERARSFYERFGFRRFLDDDDRLFLPMVEIEQLPGQG